MIIFYTITLSNCTITLSREALWQTIDSFTAADDTYRLISDAFKAALAAAL